MHRTNLLFALFALSALLLITPGCAGLGALQYQGMDARQIHEAVKDKNLGASCIIIGGATPATILGLNNDAGVVKNGTATLDCGSAKATFSNGDKK